MTQKRRRDKPLHDAWKAARLIPLPTDGATRAFLRRLAAKGIDTVPDLLRVFEDLPRRTQEAAIRLLGEIRDRRSAPLLIRLFDEARFCPTACESLSDVGGRRILRFTMRVVSEELDRPHPERDTGTLGCALDALASMDENVEAIPLLLRAASDPSVHVSDRGSALFGLAMIADDLGGVVPHAREVQSVVLAALVDPSPTVRWYGIVAADELRLEASIPTLRRIAREDRSRPRVLGSLRAIARQTLWSQWAYDVWQREVRAPLAETMPAKGGDQGP